MTRLFPLFQPDETVTPTADICFVFVEFVQADNVNKKGSTEAALVKLRTLEKKRLKTSKLKELAQASRLSLPYKRVLSSVRCGS